MKNVVLLENIHSSAEENFQRQGFQVTSLGKALGPQDLKTFGNQLNWLGIRSKTHVTAEVIDNLQGLLAIGCYCIGTNQVDLKAARKKGIPVFNAPHSNTRSVAELVIAEIIFLARKITDRIQEMHQGIWHKTHENCWEIRGKTLGIIGYGHIGSQVSVLAEAMGMRVVFYDIVKKLPLGNARPLSSLEDLLRQSDFVTLHVPLTPQTENLINRETLKLMKKGAYLLNLSRGTVVDIPALAEALQAQHLCGAAIDVYPEEPEEKKSPFQSPLQKLSNVILTPHIGGSTEEAQARIGEEVSQALIDYYRFGRTLGAVNFPRADLPLPENSGKNGFLRYRITHIHRNEPGALNRLTQKLAEKEANITGQTLMTDEEIGYAILDIESIKPMTVESILVPGTIKARIIPIEDEVIKD